MSPPTKIPPATLLWGEDGFLLREAAFALVGDLRPTEVDAAEWRGGELQDLATPSLFGERRALLVNGAKNLSKEALSELAAYLAAPDPASLLVLCAQVGERAKAPVALEKLVKPAGQVREVKTPARKDLEGWVAERATTLGMELPVPAARALVGAIGESPAELVRAVEQLASAFPGRALTPDLVASQFRGLGEQKVWDLCDRAFGKDLSGAIRSLRSIEEGPDDPLMVLGGIASRLRDLMKVRALPDRMAPAEVAREAGLRFEWQARRYQQQARAFSMPQLVRLHERVTEADRALKSGASADVVMPTLVAAIAVQENPAPRQRVT
ncbi:MAG: DNA polymerase III subunit delta [Actinobacteria bacterium]|nr:DNA polymerase III subunit delta [Actinomycetota bacterium]